MAPAATPALVFIHGIKGAELVDEQGELSWLTPRQALALATPPLQLPQSFPGGEAQARDGLRAGQVLAALHFLPVWLPLLGDAAAVAIYGPFLAAAPQFGRPFYPFSYDWRRENLETVAAFRDFLRGVKAKSGGVAPTVIAHSMGGLITLALASTDPDLVGDLVLAGVPISGGVGFLIDLHAGTKTGLNPALLAPEVLASFPSIFSLFPETCGATLVEASGEPPQNCDFYSPETWQRLRLGPFRDGAKAAVAPAFFTETLRRAKRFRQLIDWQRLSAGDTLGEGREVKPRRILVIAGGTLETFVQAVHHGPKAVQGWDFTTGKPVLGDGRVALSSAVPPSGVPYQLVTTAGEHAELLNRADALTALRNFLGSQPDH